MLFLPLSINVVVLLDIVYRKKPSQSKFHPRGERDRNKNRAKDFDLNPPLILYKVCKLSCDSEESLDWPHTIMTSAVAQCKLSCDNDSGHWTGRTQ